MTGVASRIDGLSREKCALLARIVRQTPADEMAQLLALLRESTVAMTPHLPHALRIERGGSPTQRASGRLAGAPGRPRRAESTRGIDVFPRPAASPGARGSVRVPHTPFTGVPRS
jgi:hypothetical protein